MNTVVDIKQAYSEHFAKTQSNLIGHNLPWLQSWREDHLAQFLQTGFPSHREENWKYTDLRALEKDFFAISNAVDIAAIDAVLKQKQLSTTQSHVLVFVNGCFVPQLSKVQALPQPVLIMPISEALVKQADRMQSHFQNKISPARRLASFNAAFMTDGVFIYLPTNTVLEQPIHLLFIATKQQQAHLVCPHNIVILEANSQAIIFEEHLALDNAIYFKNSVTQMDIGAQARLDYYKLQNENKQAIHIADTQIQQCRDSQVQSNSFSLGSRLARDDLQLSLNEPGADCSLQGLYVLNEQQHIDHHTRIDHHTVHGTSEECYKGILTDKATGVFNGKVVVHPQAQRTNAQQSNKNLLLSNTAEINTKPELEIYADDVKCSHGATVGQIDPESLFYLRSRGISEAEAISLLTYAFASEITNKIKHAFIAEPIRQWVTQKLPQK